jgi:hypothetical protein
MKRDTEKHCWRFRGICADAAALGVHRTHLYKVLSGERPGKSLTARYQALKAAQSNFAASCGEVSATARESKPSGRKYLNSPKRVPPSINQAAAENLSPVVFAMLEKLGLSIVIVRFTWSDKPEITEKMYCGEELGDTLAAGKAGYYDSTYYDLGTVWHFFYSKHVGEAVRILRDAVAARGLLDFATILMAEESNKAVVWYPPTAQTIEA